MFDSSISYSASSIKSIVKLSLDRDSSKRLKSMPIESTGKTPVSILSNWSNDPLSSPMLTYVVNGSLAGRVVFAFVLVVMVDDVITVVVVVVVVVLVVVVEVVVVDVTDVAVLQTPHVFGHNSFTIPSSH